MPEGKRLPLPRRWIAVAGVLAAAVLLAACHPVFGQVAGPIRHGTLTSASGMKFHYGGTPEYLLATPGLPSDGNVREVFWSDSAQWYANQQSCITWQTVADPAGSGPLQPGLAMRIGPSWADNTGIKAVTITQNIWYAGFWLFNVHIWDSKDTAHPFTLIRTFDLSSIVGKITVVNGHINSTMVPTPWHICARTLGRQLSFMLWTGDNPQPSWNDPSRVYTTTLPAGWDQPGYSGGYIGHLRPGQGELFTGQSAEPLCRQPDGKTPPHCVP